jgi:hypothetical protein
VPVLAYTRADSKGESDDQESAINDWLRAHPQPPVSEVFREVGAGGGEAMRALVARVRAVEGGTVVAASLSALIGGDDAAGTALLALLAARRWRLVLVADALDSATTVGRTLLRMAAELSECERTVLALRGPGREAPEPVLTLSPDRTPALADLLPGAVALRHAELSRADVAVVELPCHTGEVVSATIDPANDVMVVCRACRRAYLLHLVEEGDDGWGTRGWSAELTVLAPALVSRARRPKA